MNIPLPKTKRKKALFIIDVQPVFINKHNRYIIENIVHLIKNSNYDLYVTAVFFSQKGDLWDIHRGSIIPKNSDTKVVDQIKKTIPQHKHFYLTKQTRSMFHGDIDLVSILNENNIEEIHITGLETDDCVLATALESFDLGFYPYVIEECCESSTEDLHKTGIKLLRDKKMTNHSYI